MMEKFMSRLALVTGGTTGIGAAICKLLKKLGYTIASNYVHNDAVANKFTTETDIKTFKWDVSNYKSCVSNVSKIEKFFGKNIDILINNAGITQDVMLHKSELENWDTVINTNLTSCYNMSRAVINKMRDNNFGRIISISSVNALAGQLGQTNYSASKAGIIGFTKSLALESALKSITVNAIAPGYINTRMLAKIDKKILDSLIQKIPVKRLGAPEEVARVVAFLASDDAGFITGETISVNGGLYLK
jgi:acetoacetyl-CoA reductase